MLEWLESALSAFASVAEPVGWLTLGTFLVGVALTYVDREYARYVFVLAWVAFAVFWLSLVYPFFAVDNSIIRGVGALVAVPLSILVGRTLLTGRDELFTLSRAVALMGVIYVPFVMIPALREPLVMMVTGQTEWVINLLGFDPPVVTELSDIGVDREIAGKKYPYENTFVFAEGDITYTIIIDCTGIGSMGVIAGLVGAVRAPLRRKLKALAVALPIIYVLNIVRNVFIALSFGEQYMHFFPNLTMALFGLESEFSVSYIWADRILAQTGSVIAMVLIFWLVVRILPEVMDPVEAVLYLLTGTEYDLADALNVDRADTAEPEAAD